MTAASGERVDVAVLVGAQRPPMPEVAGATFRYANADQLPDAVRGAEALLVWDFAASGLHAALPHADRLRWIHVSSAGVDRVLSEEVRRRDLVVTNTRGVLDQTMAEYVLALLLAHVKDLPRTVRQQARHEWRHRPTARLSGRRALIIGCGAIGRSTARLLQGVGVQVDGVARTARTDDPPFGRVYDHTELTRVLPAYDTVIIAAPLTDQTRGLFDADAIGALDPSAFLINVGRGEILDEGALRVALAERRIAGAALDVFDREPLQPGDPIWDLPGVIVSPHMAGDYEGWRADLLAVFVDNLQRFVEGRPLRNVVDLELGYVRSD